MPKLEVLIMAENELNAINDRSFESLESLKHFNLSNNNLPHISQAFGGCDKTKLAELDLAFNSIVTLHANCFQ
jgi:Leucine-rich repeat (LRR) protein